MTPEPYCDENGNFVHSESSEWKCYLFGSIGNSGIAWRPAKGGHPNFFWRWMQYICFGNRWVKEKN